MSSRSIFGRTVSPVLAYALAHPDLFASPCTVLPWRSNPFAARAHRVDIRKGDLIAIHAASTEPRELTHRAALRLREALDTSVPTHHDPYRTIAGRIVAVATLAGATSRGASGDPWRNADLRGALGFGGTSWWAELGAVVVLGRPVEAAGDIGLWSLEGDTTREVMAQVRAVESAATKGAA